MRVCLAAGGTGGHLLPGLATAKELRSRGHGIHFIVRRDEHSQALLAREGFASSSFAYAGFPRRFSLAAMAYPLLSLAAYGNARRVLAREAPDAVLGMGGYISVPVGLAAARRRIPLVLHEQNSRAGLANRLLSRWAAAVGTSFPETQGLSAGRAEIRPTGLPLRPDLIPKDPAQARRELGLDPDAPTILIFGGSQGARTLNRLAAAALPGWAKSGNRPQFIHLTGRADRALVEDAYRRAGLRVFVKEYWNDMAALYSAADFVVARSGANTVMELARMGRPALLVPFPYATDAHQEANARYLEGLGQATVALERDLTPEGFRRRLEELPDVSTLRAEARRRLEGLPSSDAAGRLANLVEETVRRKP